MICETYAPFTILFIVLFVDSPNSDVDASDSNSSKKCSVLKIKKYGDVQHSRQNSHNDEDSFGFICEKIDS